MPRFSYRPIVLAALGLSTFDVHAASLAQLYARVPAPPADVGAALAASQTGQLTTAEYRVVMDALAAERASISALAGGTYPALEAVGALDASEPAEVREAARAYDAYLAAHAGKQEPGAALAKRTRWLQAAMGGRLAKVMARIQPCAEPCADAQTLAAREEKARIAQQDLAQFGALFADWTQGRASLVARADAQIQASGEGAAAQTSAGRVAIARLRAAMLREIEVALSVTELAVKRAWAIDSGQVDAVSSATRNAKATTK